jgi:hypothetical protein
MRHCAAEATIVGALTQRYGISRDTARPDLDDLVEELLAAGALVAA